MRLSVVGALAAAAASVPFLRQVRIRLLPVTDHERRTLTRLVDLLVPRDDTPGAVDLDIHLAILGRIEASRWDGRRLAQACLWLDRRARADHDREFLELDETRQVALMERMEAEPRASDPARAFRFLRHETMSLYYARPESWAGLGIEGPPQPLGYPDYADLPRARSS